MDPRTPELPFVAERYRALKVLGGGMAGTVYLAVDEVAGRDVALKEFFIQEGVSMKFLQELSNIIMLDHPNIVRCLDVVYGHQNRNYLVYELVTGGSLRARLSSGRAWPMGEALQVMLDVCRGLDYAHSRQFIHRDLKPENILQAGTALEPVCRIADFGIARYLGEQLYASTHNGSPAYMAPEQFYDEYGYSVDLYALGVMFYEMLAGTLPFKGPPAKMMMAHLKEQPDMEAITDTGARALIARLLAKEPALRPASAAEVLAALEQLADSSHSHFHTSLPPVRNAAPRRSRSVTPSRGEHAVPCPASRELAALPDDHPTHLVLLSNEEVGSYDLEGGRWEKPLLKVPALCVTPFRGKEDLLAATTAGILAVSPGRPARALFEVGHKIQAMAVSSDGRRVAMAGSRQVLLRRLDHQGFAAAEVRNYTLRPCVHWCADGRLAVSSGPVNPRIHFFTRDLVEQESLSLSGPASSFWTDPSGRLCVSVFQMDAQKPMSVVRCGPDGPEEVGRLGCGIYQTFHTGGHLVTASVSGRVEVHGPDLGLVGAWEVQDSQVLSAVWFAATSQLALLAARSSEFVIQFLHTQKDAAAAATTERLPS